jgi:hypothetical protein
MSKYWVNKFLFQIDRDPDLLERYRTNPRAMVESWEQSMGPMLTPVEISTVNSFTAQERDALINHDYVALFEMGAHFFLNLTLFIAVYEEEYTARSGPLSFQREFGQKLSHWLGKDYPTVAI